MAFRLLPLPSKYRNMALFDKLPPMSREGFRYKLPAPFRLNKEKDRKVDVRMPFNRSSCQADRQYCVQKDKKSLDCLKEHSQNSKQTSNGRQEKYDRSKLEHFVSESYDIPRKRGETNIKSLSGYQISHKDRVYENEMRISKEIHKKEIVLQEKLLKAAENIRKIQMRTAIEDKVKKEQMNPRKAENSLYYKEKGKWDWESTRNRVLGGKRHEGQQEGFNIWDKEKDGMERQEDHVKETNACQIEKRRKGIEMENRNTQRTTKAMEKDRDHIEEMTGHTQERARTERDKTRRERIVEQRKNEIRVYDQIDRQEKEIVRGYDGEERRHEQVKHKKDIDIGDEVQQWDVMDKFALNVPIKAEAVSRYNKKDLFIKDHLATHKRVHQYSYMAAEEKHLRQPLPEAGPSTQNGKSLQQEQVNQHQIGLDITHELSVSHQCHILGAKNYELIKKKRQPPVNQQSYSKNVAVYEKRPPLSREGFRYNSPSPFTLNEDKERKGAVREDKTRRERDMKWQKNEIREYEQIDRQEKEIVRGYDGEERRHEQVKHKKDVDIGDEVKQWDVMEKSALNSPIKEKAVSSHDETIVLTTDHLATHERVHQYGNLAAEEKPLKQPLPEAGPSTQSCKSIQQEQLSQERNPDADLQLVRCEVCNRKFKEDRLEKHISICQKIQKPKRQVYNSSQHRLKGTDQGELLKTKGLYKAPEPDHAPAAGGFQPSTDPNPHYINSPHCTRHSPPEPAERHNPICQQIKSRNPPPRKRQHQIGFDIMHELSASRQCHISETKNCELIGRKKPSENQQSYSKNVAVYEKRPPLSREGFRYNSPSPFTLNEDKERKGAVREDKTRRERDVKWQKNEIREYEQIDRQEKEIVRGYDGEERRHEQVKHKKDVDIGDEVQQWDVMEKSALNSPIKGKAVSSHDETIVLTTDHLATHERVHQYGNLAAEEKPLKQPLPEAGPSTQSCKSIQQGQLSQERNPDADLQLVRCEVCNRKFKEDRLEKHISICQKIQKPKRQVYNSSQHRLKGTDQGELLKTKGLYKAPEKQEAFVENIQPDHAPAAGGFQPSTDPNPHYITSPHCTRRFAPGPAERHIPKWQHIKSRPPPPMQHQHQIGFDITHELSASRQCHISETKNCELIGRKQPSENQQSYTKRKKINQRHAPPAVRGFQPRADANPHYITCPHCTRLFAPVPADRHIPICQNIKNRQRQHQT
ncbi:trichohyalin-like isoform X2 [Tachysurus fulvidraco]|uniref:trichohyalin-like isoform X2 n=1 Tax=Tachysurus fulvidraco TaxID=1234273 RepID=UPI001FEE5A72|nr:trichohyalin-like isoform X2 [Tachysurus fulvidraco]